MKNFLYLLFAIILTMIACVPIENKQIHNENYSLKNIKYSYQTIDGHNVMFIKGRTYYGNTLETIIPVDNFPKIDTITFSIPEEVFQKEYDRFVDWYKENHYDEYYYETKEAIDIVNKIIQEYQKE